MNPHQAFVGNKGSEHYHVFELTRQLPRFAMYCRLLEPSGNAPPRSHVHFRLNERAARVALWLNQVWLKILTRLEPSSNCFSTHES